MKDYILALDQGTTSSRAILFDREQNILGLAQKEFTQHYPREGWVEHDPMEIYSSQYAVMAEVLAKTGVAASRLAGVGVTNQRETAILWEKATGRPVHNAIVWQCRRTAGICRRLKEAGLEEYVRKATGLVIDAYFSATKIMWLLEEIPGLRQRAEAGEILFGTVDSWLIWKLTGGRVHATDRTNASRTMLFNIHTLDWDHRLLKELDIPRCMLPRVLPSGACYGELSLENTGVPILGAVGDQQAALFGQACFDPGQAKNTYGTGCFLLMNTGEAPCASQSGLLTTLAAGLEGEEACYAVEGSVFVGGAVIQWLRDELRIITDARDSEYYARQVEDTGGVYIVPAFTGLGAPHWDMYARGSIFGITRGTRRAHIIRAAEESIAFQTKELLDAVERDTEQRLQELNVDGGASRDGFLMQFQADILDRPLRRPAIRETTALGAAYLAGLTAGLWKDRRELRALWRVDQTFTPAMGRERRAALLTGWGRAVERAKGWLEED